jgi:hypothetical protein
LSMSTLMTIEERIAALAATRARISALFDELRALRERVASAKRYSNLNMPRRNINMPRLHILTPELLATVPELLQQGLSKPQIAERFGCTVGTLTVKCSNAKISLRPGGPRKPKPRCLPPIAVEAPPLVPKTLVAGPISREAKAALKARAESKGSNIVRLVSDLLEVIARDNLYDAVLDETKPETVK